MKLLKQLLDLETSAREIGAAMGNPRYRYSTFVAACDTGGRGGLSKQGGAYGYAANCLDGSVSS